MLESCSSGPYKLYEMLTVFIHVLSNHFFNLLVADQNDRHSTPQQFLYLDSEILLPVIVLHDIIWPITLNVEHHHELCPCIGQCHDRAIYKGVNCRIRLKGIDVDNIWGFHHDRL